MADNYLERKMEEHRNGAPHKSVRKIALSGCKPGIWQLPFPERRVLLLGEGTTLDSMIVEQLRSVGCKVAFIGGDKEAGTSLARKIGAQFHPVDYHSHEALRASVALICRSWHDIDAIVTTTGCFPEAVAQAWLRYRADKPYPNPFGGRIVAVAPASLPSENDIMQLGLFGISVATVTAQHNKDRAVAAMMAINHKFTIS